MPGKGFSIKTEGSPKIRPGNPAAAFFRVRRIGANLVCLAAVLFFLGTASSHAGLVVIGHKSLQAMDKTVVSRIFSGRTVQVEGIAVQPVNLKAGDAQRSFFLGAVLQQSDDDYVAYWIVRRAIGRGTPPLEVDNARAVINFVRTTKGAVGYVDEGDLVPEVNVLLILPVSLEKLLDEEK